MKNKLNINNIIITFFGIGKIPLAPGTFGSLAAIPIGILSFYLHEYSIFLIIIFLFLLGIVSSNIHQKLSGIKDDRIIVIDEVVGQLIAMVFCKNSITLIIFSFLFFRLFDILKPWPASYADKKIKGGLGVMLDDVFAGIYASFIIFFLSDYI